MSNDTYPKAYGTWAGNPQGHRPDYTRCCRTLYERYISYQCTRKRGYGPGEAYCKQHAKRFEATS